MNAKTDTSAPQPNPPAPVDGELEDGDGRTPGRAIERFAVRDDTGALPQAYETPMSLAVSLSRAEIDQQITTARAYPRAITTVVRNILTLATLDDETAMECVYALPRGGKAIKGPSIRLAEIIVSQWGNCRVGARVVHVDRVEKFVEAEGVFHDLESNTATTSRVRRRLSDKRGRLLNDDMIVVTGNAASAIAKRNAILGGVPKAIWRRAYSEVEHVIAGDVRTLGERRDKALKAFAAFGVTPEQLFAALEIPGVDDIGVDSLVTLIAMHSALKSGEETVEEMFPSPKSASATTVENGKRGLADFAAGAASGAQVGEKAGGAAEIAQAGKGTKAKTANAPAEPALAEKPKPAEPAPAAPATSVPAKPGPAEKGEAAGGPSQAPATPAPAAGGGGEAQSSAAPASSAAGSGFIEPEQRKKVAEYAQALASQTTATGLQRAGTRTFGADMPETGAYGAAVAAIFAVHLERVTDKIGSAEADNRVRKIVGGL